jgi:hypothetical protein
MNRLSNVIIRNCTTKLLPTVLTSISTLNPASELGKTIACSNDGKYMSVCASGVILSTTNYGASFTQTTFTNLNHAIGMNATGQYQVSITTGNPACVIYLSTN